MKIKDMTIKEVMDFCDKQKDCSNCPLENEGICKDGYFCPRSWDYIKGQIEVLELDTETGKLELIEVKDMNEEKPSVDASVTYTEGQADIINKYYAATMNCLIGDAVIMDTGSSWDAMVCVTDMINKLSDKEKNRIRSIVLGYKYKKYVKE